MKIYGFGAQSADAKLPPLNNLKSFSTLRQNSTTFMEHNPSVDD